MDAENVVDGGIRHRAYQVREALENMDITRPDAPKGFVKRIAEENGWTIEHAQAADREYRRFLLLAWTTTEMVVPSRDVDAVWHEHLLHTRHYWDATCRDILGKTFHHDPGDGSPVDADMHAAGYDRTLALYEQVFGEPAPQEIWPRACRCDRPAAPTYEGSGAVLALPGWTIPAAVAPISYAWIPGALGISAALVMLLMAMVLAIAARQTRLAEEQALEAMRTARRRSVSTDKAVYTPATSQRSAKASTKRSGRSDRSSDTTPAGTGGDDGTMAALWISTSDNSGSHSPTPCDTSVSHSTHTDSGSSHSSHSCGGSSSHSCGGSSSSSSCSGSSCGGSSCGGGGCGGS